MLYKIRKNIIPFNNILLPHFKITKSICPHWPLCRGDIMIERFQATLRLWYVVARPTTSNTGSDGNGRSRTEWRIASMYFERSCAASRSSYLPDTSSDASDVFDVHVSRVLSPWYGRMILPNSAPANHSGKTEQVIYVPVGTTPTKVLNLRTIDQV